MLPAATVQWQRSCLAKAPGGPPRQRQPQTRAEFAFVLQALAFNPCTLGTKLVAQGLSPLRHLPDLGEVGDVPGKHQLGEDEWGGQQSACLQHTSTPVSVSGDSWRARAEPDRVPANCCQGTACGQRCCHPPGTQPATNKRHICGLSLCMSDVVTADRSPDTHLDVPPRCPHGCSAIPPWTRTPCIQPGTLQQRVAQRPCDKERWRY